MTIKQLGSWGFRRTCTSCTILLEALSQERPAVLKFAK
jgi:hypothetical protein